MAESVTLATQPRQGNGTRKARNLRKQGQVPGIVYGHKEAVVAVTVSAHDLGHAIRHGARLVELQLDGKKEQALIHQVQWDHLGMELVHVDFKRVSADERVVVPVRLELRGHAPGLTAGGVLDQPIHNVQVECLVTSVPESIRVNIGEMQIGSVLHLRDLVLPPGVKLMADPEAVMVQLKAPEVEPEAAPAVPTEAAATAAEPEVITRRVAEEPEEEEKKK
jgi:large subunit ribosomal protein L25